MWANPSNRTHIEVSFRAGGRWKVHVLKILKRAFAVIAQCLFVLKKRTSVTRNSCGERHFAGTSGEYMKRT